MKLTNSILCILILSLNACSQSIENKLIGIWEPNFKNIAEFNECPDFIEFCDSNQYYILNECYAFDMTTLTVESGFWKINEEENTIEFYNRVFETNYYFFSEDDKIKFDYRLMENNEVELSFIKDSKIYREIYKKRE